MDWRNPHGPVALLLALCLSCNAQKVDIITPRYGGGGGATRLTINGAGFAQERQFQLNPSDGDFGNRVTLVSNKMSVPCDVERDSSHSTQIMCYTRAMPLDQYYAHVTVNGVPIPDSKTCKGLNNQCRFYAHTHRTPTITAISPTSGPPGTLVTIRGSIMTDVYGSNTALSSNGRNTRVVRVFMGGMPCELLKPNSDELYRLELDRETSTWGYMTCKMTGTYVGHSNLSYILDAEYGRSTVDKKQYRVSTVNRLSMFQTFAEVTGVTPSNGSVLGGTLITVHGRFFDQTDRPAMVLVGGKPCRVRDVSDNAITCMTPRQPMRTSNRTASYPGGRGWLREVWNDTRPRHLEEILAYGPSDIGYSTEWMDSLPYSGSQHDYFTSRLRGFFVPPATGHYSFNFKCDDRCKFTFTNSTRPGDKGTSFEGNRHGLTNTGIMALEKGEAYPMEVLDQQYTGGHYLYIGLFTGQSAFTKDQSEDAVNEMQLIGARYDIKDEKQVIMFKSWSTMNSTVQEIQKVAVVSSCEGQFCASSFFSLRYGDAETGPIAVSATAEEVGAALNSLWSLEPDSVQVAKEARSQGADFTVTFVSKRGDFEDLAVLGTSADTNVSVTEVTKGQGSMETFTLSWGGASSQPITFNATGAQVKSALEQLLVSGCPAELQATESKETVFYQDYEGRRSEFNTASKGTPVSDTEAFCGAWSLKNPLYIFMSSYAKPSSGTYGNLPLQLYPMLCLAHRGSLKNEITAVFTYRNDEGLRTQKATKVPASFSQGDTWGYTCTDLLSYLQTQHQGNDFQLQQLHLHKAAEDFYVDSISLGRRATTNNIPAALRQRRPARFAGSGRTFESLAVTRVQQGHGALGYEVTARPLNCAHGFPLMGVGFLQKLSNSTEDMAEYRVGGTKVIVSRSDRATAPLKGTFDIEIYGGLAEGIPLNISRKDLKYTLEGIPGMGQVTVIDGGTCKSLWWRVEWLTRPGDQPLMKVNSSKVIGNNPTVAAKEVVMGGMAMRSMGGDFIRTHEDKPQVGVMINGIPSKCSGDCAFEWSEDRTPVVTGMSPTQGSHSAGTLVTITGTGFSTENATVMIGDARCEIQQVTPTTQVCRVGSAPAGTFPLRARFPSLGWASFQGDVLNFTYQLMVTSIQPESGSMGGGTLLTVTGYGFGRNATVKVGDGECRVVNVAHDNITCRTPEVAEGGPQSVEVWVGQMSRTASSSFTYDDNSSLISDMAPENTTVTGYRVLNITGANLGTSADEVTVFVGHSPCPVLEWSPSNVSCVLPVLPPGPHRVDVQVGDEGNPRLGPDVNASIRYVLEVHSVLPKSGSLLGGTRLTISGAGFSANTSLVRVSVGRTECEVMTSSEDELECMLQSTEEIHTVTNHAFFTSTGEEFAWEPSSLDVSVGDTVAWHWTAPDFQDFRYRVFSVASPGSTTYKGGPFNSGGSATATGFFRYRFTSPGVYYYSSGTLSQKSGTFMQGVVRVRRQEDQPARISVSVDGMRAHLAARPPRMRRALPQCTAEAPDCTPSANQTSGPAMFSLSPCATPAVTSIFPLQANAHQLIRLQGVGFSDIACANEVTVAGRPCTVHNSTQTEIFFRVPLDSGAPMGVPHPVTLRVHNQGAAVLAIPGELERRLVLLPVVDSVEPPVGSPTGYTRLSVWGSGFSEEGLVTVAGTPCEVVSVNYTLVVCDTGPRAKPGSGEAVYQAGRLVGSCAGDCSFSYDASATPSLDGTSPGVVNGNSTATTLSGSGFGDTAGDLVVSAGRWPLEVTAVTDGAVTLRVGALPAGEHALRVIVRSKGLASGAAALVSPARASLAPLAGSKRGQTPLVITGNGFAPGGTRVTVGGRPCSLREVTPGWLRCLTPPAPAEGAVEADVQITVFDVEYPLLNFTYSRSLTPNVTSVTPATGAGGASLLLEGRGFGSDAEQVEVMVGDAPCNVTKVDDTHVWCTAGGNPGGTYGVSLQHWVRGGARSEVEFTHELLLSGVQPSEGSFGGGAMLVVSGSGFDPHQARVLICGEECEVHRNRSTETALHCMSPANNGSAPQQVCTVSVVNPLTDVNASAGFTYKAELTPVVLQVSPRRGGTAGGTHLTISGSGFSTSVSQVSVTVAGSVCDVQSTNLTHIICVTNSQARSQETKVRVSIGDRGIAKMDHSDFFYIDVWSSRFTWGGLPPPEKGTFAVITEGQTILLDESTPVLKMLLIQGGTLVFDEKDIELQAENILITAGGRLQVGQEGAPFQHKAIITLHGHPRSTELPVYGTKTLGVREGTLDLHGIPVPVTWTHLAETAAKGSSTIKLKQEVTWKAGDAIVIASTGHRHSQRENEVRTIASVASDQKTLTLTAALEYAHLGVSVTLHGDVVLEGRAEVGLLTRNVVVRGSQSVEWNDKVAACPDGFNTGEFTTQTCFQGRFGEETGSDQFGGCIMFHAPRPNENLAVGRISHVEVFHAGQAFRLGRYPIHWHLMGDVGGRSYVRGCAVHRTFNRAVTIHGTHNLLVERNVIYDVMGGAFFIEDGVETGNVLQYNLAVFVRQSTSLLNDDVTPAAYWITNPDNVVRHNAAAGGTHFGFWYRMHEHPDGPSYDPHVCQKRVPLGEFYNNTVHSHGWFGLWIFQDYFPVEGGSCGSPTPTPAVFRRLVAWNCEKGAEWVNGGALQFHDFVLAHNEKAGVEVKRVIQAYVDGFGEERGATVSDATVVGHVAALAGADWSYCTKRGVIAPLDDGLSVLRTTFVNFDRDSCAAIGVAGIDGTCTSLCGGWSVRVSGLAFVDAPNKVGFRWEHEAQLVDLDGSLTGNVNYKVVPMSDLLDPAICKQGKEFSVGFPGAVCEDSANFHRLALNNPTPTSLGGKDLMLSNQHGSSSVPYVKKRMTHKLGWMAMLPSGKTYNWYFKDVDQITNITYAAKFYSFKPDQFVIIHHNLTQRPDRFRIVDKRNASSTPLSFSKNLNGDWYLDDQNNLNYMISGKTSLRRRRASVDRSMLDVPVNFQVYRCFFPDCIPPPPPPPATLAPLPDRRPESFVLWSNDTFWETSAENNFTVPAEGADVVIPSGQWFVLDENPPPLNKLTVKGVLEIPDTMDEPDSTKKSGLQPNLRSVTIDATYISIQGGKMIAGWADEPFRGQLEIMLRGDHRTPDWPLPNGPNQGSKVLGVFGTLQLYGIAPKVYHTKLAASAAAGDDQLTLAQSVDWKVDDEVVISTTGFNAWETETRLITAVSEDGLKLTLNQSLAFIHIAGTHSVPGTETSYTLSADVGLLTRNIKVIGQAYPEMFEESFGARVLVGSFSSQGIDYKGVAQIRNVEFKHSGQQGWSDYTDPRYSVAFLNLGKVEEDESYLQGCAFHNGFSPAIGIFGTDGMSVDDNVIHHTVGEGIRIWGNRVTVRRNLVTLIRWPGSYQDREEEFNYEWTAAIEVNMGTNVVLQHNIVAGYERVGYRIDGELCTSSSKDDEAWTKNEAHGGLYGLYMNKDGLPGCSLIRGFSIWRSYDYGIYFQTPSSVIVAEVTLVDNGLGLMPMIYSPKSLDHAYADKTIQVRDCLVVGTSPAFNCSDTVPAGDYNIKESVKERGGRLPDGGRAGLSLPWFESKHNAAPLKSHSANTNYPAIRGLMTVVDTTFVAFKSDACPGASSAMIMTSASMNDLHHPVQVQRITLSDSTEEARVFIHRPNVGKVNPADCVDMECDAKKKSLLKDLDGSFLGAVGAVVPHAEYEWDGDPRRGLGDYRIPKVMLTYPNGSRIPVDQIAPNKGVIRKDCTFMEAWQSYKCFGLNYRLLAIESMDSDTETRRLSPVAILGDGYVDLINGPQDHGWCSGYTCQKRVSLFHAMVATDHAFDIFFSSVSPQKLRLMMLNAPPTESVLVSIFYSKPQRLEAYVDNKLIAPTNAEWNSDNTDYTLLKPESPGQYVPAMNSPLGTNYFDSDSKMLKVLVRGSTPVEVRTSPLLIIAFSLPTISEEDFFGDSLVQNLATFLNVPPNMIRITKIVREDSGGGGRRRKRSAGGLTVEVEIKKPPMKQTSNSTDDEAAFGELKAIANDLGQAAVTGDLSKSIGFNVSSMGIIAPPPPASDPAWKELAEEEVTREEPVVSFVASVDSLVLMMAPISGEYVGPLLQQPSLMAVDQEGNCVSVGVTTLRVTVMLKDADGVEVDGLDGNTTILFKNCWANFTDLAVMDSGDNLRMAFMLNKWRAQSDAFSVKAQPMTEGNSTSVWPSDGTIFDGAGSAPDAAIACLLSALLFLLVVQ